jgi:hypothetical protein
VAEHFHPKRRIGTMETNNHSVNSPIFLFYGLGMAILLLIADYFSGPFIQFPVSYLIPIAFLSWFHGRSWGLFLAILMPLVRFYFNIALWTIPWTIVEASINASIRMIVLSSFALVIDRTANQTRKLTKQVSMLEGLLPICSYCKKIRDQKDQWQVMEKYIMDRSEATFSHGICPDCLREQFGQVPIKRK